IPPSDISEMLLELDPYQRAALLRTLDVKRQVEIITELDLRKQKDLIEDLDTRTVVELFDRMPADEATDLLQTLSTRDAARIVTELPTRKAREIANLMRHETDSAGGLMTTEYVVLSPDMTVGDTIERIRSFAGRVETTQTSYVLDAERKLIGAVRMSSLLLESNHIRIEEIMEQKPPAIEVNSSVKDIAFLFDKYNLFVAPVVNDQGVLEGIITIDDVLSRVVDETWGERSAL
ncbi:MAG: magnesium transporter, partial [Deltaproteobacteria bacterium]|nr:magnesium transporter [Deltaproteobacteria bacterium]